MLKISLSYYKYGLISGKRIPYKLKTWVDPKGGGTGGSRHPPWKFISGYRCPSKFWYGPPSRSNWTQGSNCFSRGVRTILFEIRWWPKKRCEDRSPMTKFSGSVHEQHSFDKHFLENDEIIYKSYWDKNDRNYKLYMYFHWVIIFITLLLEEKSEIMQSCPYFLNLFWS